MAKCPAKLVASGVGSGPPQEAPGNLELTDMVVAVDTRMRAVEGRISLSRVPTLDDHAVKLDMLKARQAQMGGLRRLAFG